MNLHDAMTEVRQRIAESARRAGRNADEVRLIAASKRQPVAAIEAMIACGHKNFGESLMQEAINKIGQLESQSVEWHYIGHLQSNKACYIGENFSWVHTVDSEKIARRIEISAHEAGRTVNVLLQVNVTDDPAKYGVVEERLFPLIETLLEASLDSIELRGLMTIGYRDATKSETRRSFAHLRELLEACRIRYGTGFSELSMGMSGDYPVAIEEGATMVRVGRALFGERLA